MAGQTYQLAAGQKSTARWFNTGAFVAPPAFQFGALGRNTVIGPGLLNLDASIARKFRITDRVAAQFRAEFFNLPNHSNFNLVGRIVNQPNFGAVLIRLRGFILFVIRLFLTGSRALRSGA